MGIQLRVSLPDQPGALARVAQAIARAGADVISVSVLESEAGRAIDDFRLRWPEGRDERSAGRGGQRLHGRGRAGLPADPLAARRPPGPRPADLPARGARARHRDPRRHGAGRARRRLGRAAPAGAPAGGAVYVVARPRTTTSRRSRCRFGRPRWQSEAGAWAHFPIAALHSVLVIGRDGGPAFLRSEVAHAERILELAMMTLERVLRTTPADPTPARASSTSCLSLGLSAGPTAQRR